MSKLVFWDAEFSGTTEKHLNLVSAAYVTSKGERKTLWLHKDRKAQEEMKSDLIKFKEEGCTFVSYAVTAEARVMISLGLDPLEFKHIDQYLEYRCLLNHNHEWAYGKQLTKEGVKKFTIPPKNSYNRTEEEESEVSSSKPHHGLASACYKALGVLIDTDRKDFIRDIIIKGEEVEKYKEEILEYNESDIDYLPQLLSAFIKEYKRRLGSDFDKTELGEEMRVRGNYAARTAVMESLGYPINVSATRNFSDNVYGIIRSVQAEINRNFPEILPFTKQSNYDYSWSHVRTRAWIDGQFFEGWTRTETKKLSLSLKAFKKFFDYKHDYPSDNFGAQMVRYLTLLQNLNGFKQSATAKKKKNFWDSVGSDGRVRPYFGIYGAQSARSQPAATGFLFLKSAWMRVLCEPPKGRAIGAIDYKSQEFLLAALVSGDRNMMAAYESGDVYLYFAKLAGAVPWEGTKAEYPDERDLFKEVTLSLSYGKGYKALAQTLSEKMGKRYTESEAKTLISKFNRAYPTYYRSKNRVLREYRKNKRIKIADGWYMWGDNDNSKSVLNVPIQGLGSAIMRKAVCYAQDMGLDVIKTLHDAIYIEYDSGDFSAMTKLAKAMDMGFKYYFSGSLRERANVGLDGNSWGPDYEDGYVEVEGLGSVKIQNKYIDPRAVNQYEQFKQYLIKEDDYEI